ncbi:MAG: hypothetical protein AMXMBFR82_38220 [Candidatus Hydrogenedentota bacterium]
MLIARGGDVEAIMAGIRTMRRRVPRMPAFLAPGQQLLALFGREPTPTVFRL